MKIIIGKTAGFCFGVANAVQKSKKELLKNNEVYCLGELVHNKQVTEKLKEEGMKFIENIDEAKNKVIIRSHGVSKDTYERAKDKKIEIIDLTCPKVLKIHNIAEEYSNKGYYIFLIGQKTHPEIIGTISFCGNNISILQNVSDVVISIEKLNAVKIKNMVILCQTTFSINKFDEIVKEIKKHIRKDINMEIKETICDATRLRQEETIEISKEVDAMIIIGGKHSSNTNKLYEIANKNCKNVFFVENKEDLKIKLNFEKIGIMAGASTPKENIKEIVEHIKKM